MITLISIIGALALAAIPIAFGWRRTVDEAGMARAMGIAQPKKNFDPEKFARQTGTGLAFNQIAYGFLAWVGGGLAGGATWVALRPSNGNSDSFSANPKVHAQNV